jgi:hypothetical protein
LLLLAGIPRTYKSLRHIEERARIVRRQNLMRRDQLLAHHQQIADFIRWPSTKPREQIPLSKANVRTWTELNVASIIVVKVGGCAVSGRLIHLVIAAGKLDFIDIAEGRRKL